MLCRLLYESAVYSVSIKGVADAGSVVTHLKKRKSKVRNRSTKPCKVTHCINLLNHPQTSKKHLDALQFNDINNLGSSHAEMTNKF